jgi:hypothetical protein
MEKQLEYFDVLANAQKQVFNNLLGLQKDLRTQWIDVVSKSYTALTSIPGVPETAQTKEALAHFNTWFGTVANGSKSATEEALKTQESWISAYEKQVLLSRSALKNIIDLATPVELAAPVSKAKAKAA